MGNVGIPIETDDQRWERYQEKQADSVPLYTRAIVDAASHDWCEFINWLDRQDGQDCDRDFIMRFLEKPWKWQTEWERFTKEMEAR